ncbi:sporulation integral membrane protein YtvI [Cytobacillus horneckiae]|uniref:Sporulation integral membrane protein YtvI n=1 Tax=Cytobacillus horneckiae TaxID=549687 RepID=A0A2N0ZHW5_9BACI|nr:sporulation integral membrane protein YtvI [Cytobacillus horneckiae]MBN6886903.1 sporulation integral membrane protein YtvI [Cytobacillus horneckiae]MCM3177627.1 sporulation integral membrane protein YtvI [Cytobacillus horneckiae]MEC1157932.1 sporulation integral membrane protein YtvI [Cytobacillus horneckiae]MED2937143.1 sporulation integral membrane protein YtvI [Cytobacillus horneckiae]PKG29117.1 sporulation integral membrane protein YtvI [Cytobacillus horneckiae]
MKLSKSMVRKAFIILALVIAAVFIYFNFSAFMPVLLALLTALIFEPFVRMCQKYLKSEKRIYSVTIIFLLFVFICSLVLYISIKYVFGKIYDWSLLVPQYAIEIERAINKTIKNLQQYLEGIPEGDLLITELNNFTHSIIEKVMLFATNVLGLLADWLQAIPNMLFVGIFYLIILFLFSLELPKIKNNFFKLFKPETSTKLRYVTQKMGTVFLGYWKAQFILSVGVFLICYLCLLFISPNLALLMSFIIWIVDIIPLYVGPALVLVPWGLIVILLGNTAAGIQLMILALVLLIVRRIIEPKVLGDSIGLNALPTVLSMYFGYVFFGVMGLIAGPFVYIAIRSAKEAGLFDRKTIES